MNRRSCKFQTTVFFCIFTTTTDRMQTSCFSNMENSTYGSAFQLSSCMLAHGPTFPEPQSAGHQPCADVLPSAAAAARPRLGQFHGGVYVGWWCANDLSEQPSRSASESWRSSLPRITIVQYRVYFRPLKKGVVLPLAIVKKGKATPWTYKKGVSYSLNMQSITNKTKWFL